MLKNKSFEISHDEKLKLYWREEKNKKIKKYYMNIPYDFNKF